MPIYEYQCSKCDHQLEAIQKFSDAPLIECPACHETALKKLISAASFRLKGGGWYETDFKKEGRKQLAESDSGADSSARASGSSESASPDSAKKSSANGDSSPKPETTAKKTTADTAKKS